MCSALTRAGISCVHLFYAHAPAFRPHKGGYIGQHLLELDRQSVPPSQGRVYQSKESCIWVILSFRPHKGWYIINSIVPAPLYWVPPSQGRVYHKYPVPIDAQHRSALTRAGISGFRQAKFLLTAFRPHKGGYIFQLNLLQHSDIVPPSQGRVYHVFSSQSLNSSRSALTRAGISRSAPTRVLTSKVPPSQGRVYR